MIHKIKTKLLFFILLLTSLSLYSQTNPVRSTVAILPFEAVGVGVNSADAVSIGNQLVTELRSWDALNILTEAQGSDYVIQGRLERINNQYVLSATTTERNTNRILNLSREEASSVSALSARIFSFAAQVTENVPFPNYLLGKWKAEIDLADGPLTCVMEFRSDRSLVIEQYDTWEHRGEYSLRYQGFGTGNYSFWGHARRTVSGSAVDGFMTINLDLDDVLPQYENLSFVRVNYNYNTDRSVFTLVGGGFSCGENFSGPRIYPAEKLFYVTFSKIY